MVLELETIDDDEEAVVEEEAVDDGFALDFDNGAVPAALLEEVEPEEEDTEDANVGTLGLESTAGRSRRAAKVLSQSAADDAAAIESGIFESVVTAEKPTNWEELGVSSSAEIKFKRDFIFYFLTVCVGVRS